MELIEEKLKTLTSYHGVIVNVRLDEARLPDGSTAKREVVEHPGGVTVLPLEADGTVWCVRQYRYPFSRTLLEVPAAVSGRELHLARLLGGGAAHLSGARPAPRRGAPRPRRISERGAASAGKIGANGARWPTLRRENDSRPAENAAFARA